MRNDPARVLREYTLEPLRAELRSAGSRVLVVRGARAGTELRAATSTRFDAAWVEIDTLAETDAVGLAQDVARVLRPGGRLVSVVPGATPLWPSVRGAFRREVDADGLRRRRAGARAWDAALAPFVEWRRRLGLGVFVPQRGDWPRRHPLAFALLAAVEHAAASRLPFRALGEWAVAEGVRR